MAKMADPEAATLRGLLEVLEALQVDNVRANGWSWLLVEARGLTLDRLRTDLLDELDQGQ